MDFKNAPPLGGGGAQVEVSELVRHRDDDAVHVFGERHTRRPRRQIGRGHMGRDAQGVQARVLKSLAHACRRFDLSDRVAHDEMDARGAVEVQRLGRVHGRDDT